MDRLLTLPHAAEWVWNNLWTSDSPQALFDLIDVVKVDEGKVVGWLFTATDGSVKRKSVPKWTIEHVESKCRDHNGNIHAHLLVSDVWASHIHPHQLQIPLPTTYILPTAELCDKHFFIEQMFEKQRGISLPKVATFRLVDPTVKGKYIGVDTLSTSSVIPAHKLTCKDKKLNEATKERMNSLISTLEQRSHSQILKLACVFVIEESIDRKFNIRLHHCGEVTLKARGTKKKKKYHQRSCSDTHSVISEITNMSLGSSRVSKCSGDFCSFSHADESSLTEMEEELNFRIDVEASKARRRHRNVDGVIESGQCDDDVAAKFQFQKDLIDSAIASNALTDSTSTTQSYKVSRKSLLLARSEMKILDSSTCFLPSLTAWSKTLQAWYRRTGRALIGQRVNSIPASSGHHIEHAMLQIAEHGSVVDEAYLTDTSFGVENEISPQKLTLKALESLEQVDSISKKGGLLPAGDETSAVQYDLQSTPFLTGQQSSSKHLGRYYSNTSVCEKCYHVYKELDRLRKLGFKHNLRSKKNLSSASKKDMQSYDIEKANRLTNQTLHNMRLSEAKVRVDTQQASRPENSFLSKEGAPKGSLPPLPWHLNRAEVAAEYQVGGSSFVRNIGSKARHLSLQGSVDMSQQGLEVENVLSPNYDWKRNLAAQNGLVKSSSAGNIARLRSKTKNTRGFNSDRLLHPHQRHLAAMKRENMPTISDPGVRVKGGAKRKMISDKKKGIGSLPSLSSNSDFQPNSNGATQVARSASPITYTYVQNKLEYPPTSIQSAKNVSFSENNSVRSIPHRSEKMACQSQRYNDDSEDDDDNEVDDEIGWSPFVISDEIHD